MTPALPWAAFSLPSVLWTQQSSSISTEEQLSPGLHHSLGTAAFQHISSCQSMLSCLHHQPGVQTPILYGTDGHCISLTPLCSRCGKVRCLRNRPGKTKVWFIILLPVTISSWPVACKKPWWREEAQGLKNIHHVQCFHACSILEGYSGRQSLSLTPSAPGAQESHQPCSPNTGRDEEQQTP